jgi:prephenate dehydrogenase
MQIKSIGIIGSGRFAGLLKNIFKQHLSGTKLMIYSRSHRPDRKLFFQLNEVCQAELIIPCVPISAFQEVLRQIRPIISPESTVMDVCSVKVYPVKWLRSTLGKSTKIIASHPVFGPDSTKNGNELKDMNLMLYNISADKKLYQNIKNFWKKLGVNVVEITPEEHDRFSAYTINYNHLIGRIGERIGIKPTPIDTKGFKVIYDALQYVTNDSWQLFADMQVYNPYAKEMRKKVARALREIEAKLEK